MGSIMPRWSWPDVLVGKNLMGCVQTEAGSQHAGLAMLEVNHGIGGFLTEETKF